MATQMTKSQLIEKIAAETELPKKGVKEVRAGSGNLHKALSGVSA